MDQMTGSRVARSQAGVEWRTFLRALAEEVDSLAGAGERDDMLRGVGRRMSRLHPLPPVQSLDALEIEMNDALEGLGWGEVRLELNEVERRLDVIHSGMPRIGSLGSPPGLWLSALLEGLYDGWFAQQPGSKAALSSRRVEGHGGPGSVVMSYAKR